MHLEPYVDRVREQLAAAAALGDERTREVAAVLATAVGPAVRLAVIAAVSDAADEITALLLDFPLAPSVSARLDGDDVRTEVSATAESLPAEPASAAEDKEASARISLRLPDALKTQIDTAAARESVSVNTWLLRVASRAIADEARRPGIGTWSPAPTRVTGWING